MQSSPYLHDLTYERVSSVDGNAWKPTSKSEGSCHTLDKPRNTAVPPTIRHSASHSLRMQSSLFMTLRKVLSLQPDSTTTAFNSLRMQTSQFTILPREKSANCIPHGNKQKQVTVR